MLNIFTPTDQPYLCMHISQERGILDRLGQRRADPLMPRKLATRGHKATRRCEEEAMPLGSRRLRPLECRSKKASVMATFGNSLAVLESLVHRCSSLTILQSCSSTRLFLTLLLLLFRVVVVQSLALGGFAAGVCRSRCGVQCFVDVTLVGFHSEVDQI